MMKNTLFSDTDRRENLWHVSSSVWYTPTEIFRFWKQNNQCNRPWSGRSYPISRMRNQFYNVKFCQCAFLSNIVHNFHSQDEVTCKMNVNSRGIVSAGLSAVWNSAPKHVWGKELKTAFGQCSIIKGHWTNYRLCDVYARSRATWHWLF